MAITMTDSAAQHVKSYLENRGKGVGLRVGIKTTGCSGLAYVLEFVDDLAEGDEVFEQKRIKDLDLIKRKRDIMDLDDYFFDYFLPKEAAEEPEEEVVTSNTGVDKVVAKKEVDRSCEIGNFTTF